ncbi:MAG: ATP-binding cassette domain-containing protein [Deltaproteobacteria bacterium]|nr:ATP-binding cassette domain-containing protein [Deltaproteobacteria bacterium]NIS77229.1 ATP-binding cassette domain-containing protein [Deltaproteobacteria bacterium]
MENHLISADNVGLVLGSGDGRAEILKGISLTVGKGEFLSIMGPSGAGKSSLMNIIGGLQTPTSGRVFVDNFDIYALDTEKRADFRRLYLGFVFQSFHLFPYLTVMENIMLPMVKDDLSRKDKEEIGVSLLGKVGLLGKERRFPSQLSGGEAQRVAVARALFNNPLIILADEPTGNLDTKNGMAILDLFSHVNEDGKTIIMITHSREYAQRAHRVVEMCDGSLGGSLLIPANASPLV